MQRLANRPQFQAVLAGRVVARSSHFALHRLALPKPSTSPDKNALFAVHAVWLGVMLPKRWARRAVTRNAIKRQVYAVSQEFESQLPCAAHVVRLQQGFERQQFISASSKALKAAVRSELQQLFGHASTKTP